MRFNDLPAKDEPDAGAAGLAGAEGPEQTVADEVVAEILDLVDRGVEDFHFYTMNKSTATREIYAQLGLPVA